MSIQENRPSWERSDGVRRWTLWTLRLAPWAALLFFLMAVWDLRQHEAPLEKALEAAGRMSEAVLLVCCALAARRELAGVKPLPSSGTFLLFATWLSLFSQDAARDHHQGRTGMFLLDTVLFGLSWLLSAFAVWVFFHAPDGQAPTAPGAAD